ncbi:hypothetical protein [Actinoplanes sp. DH11]|uniref:hypothetical protein n=1 Tax=Actinoplanes sp. DH11 TaxID=2857011 RepID=UPI001E32DAE2|nr:hypothetical protein [Actinoplanes sp. DH11]
MTDHWDDHFDHDFDDAHRPGEGPAFDEPGFDDPHAAAQTGAAADDHFDLPGTPELPHFDPPDTPDLPDVADPPDEVPADDPFPPALELGDLPEPVDGFPWIDTATLGTPDTGGFTPPLDPVTPEELAAYAHTGGPADWAALADSDDPATSALARWWTPDEQ